MNSVLNCSHMLNTLRIPLSRPHSLSAVLSAARSFSTTPTANNYHFDTLKFMQKLEANGFSPKQSEAVLNALSEVITESVESLSTTLVRKEVLSRQAYQQKVDFAKLRSELLTLDKTDSTQVKNEHERLMSSMDKLQVQLKEEIAKTQANVRLDLNLEKGRIREEGAVHELKIKETDTRIDTEVANVKTQLEQVKFQVMQWLIGVCTGSFALVLAYIRMLT
ncbi:coiled-coil domain-containing protein 90A,mitochondrial [Myxozyma melibiosi]|uniref:Coiled-coil domain-containing protein 90A,mitochondrial n=1 Tax=Myxozyma melibiosi TaxID=54550 RepID=A0ABR1F089_9ASCO